VAVNYEGSAFKKIPSADAREQLAHSEQGRLAGKDAYPRSCTTKSEVVVCIHICSGAHTDALLVGTDAVGLELGVDIALCEQCADGDPKELFASGTMEALCRQCAEHFKVPRVLEGGCEGSSLQ
jgi:hypothetical protein